MFELNLLSSFSSFRFRRFVFGHSFVRNCCLVSWDGCHVCLCMCFLWRKSVVITSLSLVDPSFCKKKKVFLEYSVRKCDKLNTFNRRMDSRGSPCTHALFLSWYYSALESCTWVEIGRKMRKCNYFSIYF